MTSVKEKALLGVGGAVGVSVAAWRGFFPWIGYDIKNIRQGIKLNKLINRDLTNKTFFIDTFEHSVKRVPKRTCIIFEDRMYTYEFVNEQACKVANTALRIGLKFGDTAIMLMHNEPAFVWTLLGLQKIGVVVSLVNTHIRQKALLHSINASEGRLIIVGGDQNLQKAVDDIKGDITIPVYLMGLGFEQPPSGYLAWDQLMLTATTAEICKSARSLMTETTPLFYMFTSGTTGLPKPAIVSNRKGLLLGHFFFICGVDEDDIIYCTLPLYHLSGCGGVLMTLSIGGAVVLRSKFSADHFFDDCRKYNVTVIQYIGELCRFLLGLPESPQDKEHKIRLAFGNGLRMDIWERFVKRFNIKEITDVYGSTEGTSILINNTGKVGAVGRMSPLLRKINPYGIGIVKYDKVNDRPFRDKNNRCIHVKVGEPGLLLQGIPPTVKAFYKGSKEMNEKKIVRDVFVEGDEYFNTGDLLYLDKDYFVYFQDRMGDTFRWKGENVSTTEVANILTMLDFILDANVYGVTVPGKDGRAGIVALHLREGKQLTPETLEQLYKHCVKNLPSYARPMFLRLCKEARITSTFKQQKVDLMKEGFDPHVISDQLFYVSDARKTYLPLEESTYQSILQSKL